MKKQLLVAVELAKAYPQDEGRCEMLQETYKEAVAFTIKLANITHLELQLALSEFQAAADPDTTLDHFALMSDAYKLKATIGKACPAPTIGFRRAFAEDGLKLWFWRIHKEVQKKISGAGESMDFAEEHKEA